LRSSCFSIIPYFLCGIFYFSFLKALPMKNCGKEFICAWEKLRGGIKKKTGGGQNAITRSRILKIF
jgi:hypothetical protein